MDSFKTTTSGVHHNHHAHLHGASARHVVGDWELIDCLGEGEWSTVYRAKPRDSATDWPADYAVKIARLDSQRRRQAKQLLACEAEVGRSAVHSNLVTVLAADLETSPPYLVMPLMHGATLAQALAVHASFSAPHALWLARQIAEALSALHEAGWLHADVKPGNVHVTSEGHATLIDLGFAMRLDSTDCRPGGSLRGSPTYTAPEMISAAVPVDGRCDIYSLGVMLYQLITGSPPFTESEPGPLMLAHLQRPVPSPRLRVPTLHRDVGVLLQSMLAKEPLRRPDTAELIQRLVDLEIATLAERVV